MVDGSIPPPMRAEQSVSGPAAAPSQRDNGQNGEDGAALEQNANGEEW